jgi:uncharacterized protein DUF4203
VPHAYEVPAAVLLALSGLLACLAGYRLFRVILAIYGFVLGAAVANSIMGATNETAGIAIAVVGGFAGAVILVLAYYVGIALVGAGLGALVAHVGWNYLRVGEPPLTMIVLLAVLGAVGAMLLQRYVIIVATAVGGAWTTILGVLALRGELRLASIASGDDLSVLYPPIGSPGKEWVPIAWLVLAVVGLAVQLGLTGRRK